ncbi:hypothetical protein ScPMuIL_012963 [Solemya velum]
MFAHDLFIIPPREDGHVHEESDAEDVPYLSPKILHGSGRKVYFETYGCQMNVNDTEVAWSILEKQGFEKCSNVKEADVVLLMTCSVREGAEKKIWNRLDYFKALKRRRQAKRNQMPLKIGILGCMAERLKSQIIEQEKSVDLVCGPDAYRDLPRMLAITSNSQASVNVVLSLDETYADILPVRTDPNSKSAFVSIMRGCDNMCSYCIVPFTRGRERSRPIESIIDEVKALSEQGIKEITLLGQNVNSYRDMSQTSFFGGFDPLKIVNLSKGFKTLYKPKKGGRRFSDLLDRVSLVNSEVRIRFTSPHPKDFPDEVLHLIKERPNICEQIHLPAQSGSTEVLAAMRRGYTREAYIDLVHHIRTILPDVALSTDFIAGFCGENEEAHQESLDLMREIQYHFAYCFPFSLRQKTRAFHRLEDDVPADVKSRRHMELIQAFREEAEKLNKSEIGKQQLVLVEGESKRSAKDLAGRNDHNTRVIFPNMEVPVHFSTSRQCSVKPGDYAVVHIISATSQVLKGIPLYHTTLKDFHRQRHLEERQEYPLPLQHTWSLQ